METISRKRAKELGLTRYSTGKPCKYGHISERLVSTRTCIECASECKKYHLENNTTYNQNQKLLSAKAEKKRDRIERNNAWKERYYSDPGFLGHQRERKKKRYNENPEVREKIRVTNQARKLKYRECKPCWVDIEDIKNIIEKKKDDYDFDHIIPINNENVCGFHAPCNIALYPSHLNRRKKNHFDPNEWVFIGDAKGGYFQRILRITSPDSPFNDYDSSPDHSSSMRHTNDNDCLDQEQDNQTRLAGSED